MILDIDGCKLILFYCDFATIYSVEGIIETIGFILDC